MNKPCSVRPGHASTIAGAVAALFAASYMPIVLANPTGAQVVAGSVSIRQRGMTPQRNPVRPAVLSGGGDLRVAMNPDPHHRKAGQG